MSGFNGSGTFNISGVGLPYVSGNVISSSVANTLNTDLATGLSTCILRDGTQTIIADIPFGNNKITTLAAGSASTDAANIYNIQCSTGTYVTVSGADTITGTVSPALTAGYVTGMTYRFFAAGTNTGAVTLDINTQGAKAVTKNGTTALVAGDIPVGVLVSVTYDGTRFVLQNQSTFATLSAGAVTITGNTSIGGTLYVTGKSLFNGGSTFAGGSTLLGTTATTGLTDNGLVFFQNQAAVSTTLSGSITATDLTINLTDGTGFPTGGGTILIDNEQITYASRAGNALTVSSVSNRGVNGTTAASHNSSAAVSSATFGSTTLSSNIDNQVTTVTIPVASTANFPNAGTIIIDSEQISYTGKTGTSFTGATRAVNGTSIASHNSSAAVVGVQKLTTSANIKYDDVTGALKVPNLTVTDLNVGTSNLSTAITTSQKVQSLVATGNSPTAGALTVTLNATALDFRSSTLTTGTATTVKVVNPISLTVASGATLGTTTGFSSRLIVLAMYTGSAVELAIVNSDYDKRLNELDLITTTALSGSSNSAYTIYSTTARSSVPYKVVGIIDFPAGTAGTWSTITEVQGSNDQVSTNLASPLTKTQTQSISVTSGVTTTATFTGIPATAKRITVLINGTSASGLGYIVKIGSGSVITTGYRSASGSQTSTDGFVVNGSSIAFGATCYCTMILSKFEYNSWLSSHSAAAINPPLSSVSTVAGAGVNSSLTNALDRVEVSFYVTSGSPTTTGNVTVMYE